ncbi:MAG: hypothetical protein WCP01_14975 [Methylococcaceae bacterium]
MKKAKIPQKRIIARLKMQLHQHLQCKLIGSFRQIGGVHGSAQQIAGFGLVS